MKKTLNLKSYSQYKPSGVEWLGDVPAHWRQLHGRACYYEKKIPNIGMQETTVLSLSYGQIVVKPVEELHGLVPASFETYQIVGPGDIIIRPTDLQNDWNSLRSGLSRHHGVITSAYMCLHTREIMSREYGHLLLHTYDLKKVFYGLGSGLRQNLSWNDFKYLPCLVPSLSEQNAIVRYLNQADERIRRYISSRERLIELLKEYRQAVIHHAVTCGLDPDVRLKPSGVEWLGDVPAHWEVRRVKQVAQIQGGFAFPADSFGNEGVPVVRMNNIRRGVLDFANVVRIPEHQCKDEFALKEGDIIYGLSGSIGATGSLGNYAVVRKGDIPAQLNQRVARFRPVIDRITEGFLVESLQTRVFYDQVLSYTTGTAQFNVSTNDIGNVTLALPPVEEQRRIVRYLSTTTAEINAAIDRARREIELLGEYRTRLIADVVTGKVDVRQVAAELSNGGE